MARSRTLVLVLAGGAGGRLGLLTERRAKPAVWFGGSHRLIDFPLSNARNAGVDDVWVAQQHDPASLSDHLANGRPWDLDRSVGGFRLLHPAQGEHMRSGFHHGTADALWRAAPLVRQSEPDVLVVVSADAVYALDYEELAEEHRGSSSQVTMVTARVDASDAGRYGVVGVRDGAVADYAYKPDDPIGDLVANEVFAFSPGPVLDRLEQIAETHDHDGDGDPGDDEGLGDLGDDLLGQLVEAGEAREHRLDRYWRDLGTVEAYWQGHQDLLDGRATDLDDPGWPIGSDRSHAHGGARLGPDADVRRSLRGAGTQVNGTVTGSVLGPCARVDAGAEVVDSILLPGAHVRAGARVTRTVCDDRTTIEADTRLGDDTAVTVIGLAASVPADHAVAPGDQWPSPGS